MELLDIFTEDGLAYLKELPLTDGERDSILQTAIEYLESSGGKKFTIHQVEGASDMFLNPDMVEAQFFSSQTAEHLRQFSHKFGGK